MDLFSCAARRGGGSSRMLAWLLTLRGRDGSFHMHHDGEVDVRGVYCAANTARLLALPTEALFAGTAAWVARYAASVKRFLGALRKTTDAGLAWQVPDV